MNEDIPISVITLDYNLVIESVNKCFKKEISSLTGINSCKLIGKNIKEIIPEYSNNLYKQQVDVLIDGVRLKCRLSVSSNNKFVYIELFHSTKRFMDFLAYEFKTPVTASVEMTSLVFSSKNQTKYIEALKENNKRLTKLLVNTIDYLKLLTFHIVFKKETISLDFIFIQVQSRIKKNKNITINYDIIKDYTLTVDKNRFIEMLVHILCFLLSRVEKGVINIKTKVKEGVLFIYFTDNGDRIQDLNLFSGFIDKEYVKESAGLELPLAKGIAKGMGGDFVLENSTDYSTTFRFSI